MKTWPINGMPTWAYVNMRGTSKQDMLMSIRRTSYQVWKVIGLDKQTSPYASLRWLHGSMKQVDTECLQQ